MMQGRATVTMERDRGPLVPISIKIVFFSFSKYRVHDFGNRRTNGRTDGRKDMQKHYPACQTNLLEA